MEKYRGFAFVFACLPANPRKPVRRSATFNIGLSTDIGKWANSDVLHPVENTDHITHSVRYQNNVAHDYDFALMKLDKPVPINHCIGVACLPRDLDTPGANCNITGTRVSGSSCIQRVAGGG